MPHRLLRSATYAVFALFVSGCAGADSIETTAATTASATTTTAAATTTATAAETTTTTSATTTTAGAVTTPGLITGPSFAVPYEMSSTEIRLMKEMTISDGWINYRAGPGQFVLFTTAGPETVDAWLEKLTNHDQLIATEPAQTEIGGQTATTIDVRNAGDSTSLFIYAPAPGEFAGWEVAEGAADRIHLMEVDGVTIAIIIEASEQDFEEFAAEIDAALSTLEWNPEG